MPNYTHFLTTTLTSASKIASEYYGHVTSTVKTSDNNQVLTKADLEIGRFLIAEIQQAYPDYNILDEESGAINKNSEYTWVVDPIDGTSNFANKVPTFGIMMGLLYQNQPVAGGVALPLFSEIYTAEKNEGAFCNGTPIQVTAETVLSNCLVAYGIDGHPENPALTEAEAKTITKLVLNIRNIRTTNSAFDYMMVARGGYAAVLSKTSKAWDNVAINILIEEAGGIYTDINGNSQNYSSILERSGDTFTMFGGSKPIHEQLLRLIQEV